MAQNPSPIFAEALNIHTVVEYGSNTSTGKAKYQSYQAVDKIKNWAINAPVKSEVHVVRDEIGQDTVVLKFLETVGIYKQNEYMSIHGVKPNWNYGADPVTVVSGKAVAVANTGLMTVAMNAAFDNNSTIDEYDGISLNGKSSPRPFIDFSLGNVKENNVENPPGSTGTTSESEVIRPGEGEGVDVGAIAKSAAYSTFFSMPGFSSTVESNSLTGQRSLMNDTPLMPFVQQLSMACLRQFMSTPNGDFFAFYPDYFGGLGKTAYWLIEDIEIISGSIELSDDNLATHVYVVGDIAGSPSGAETGNATVDFIDKINTGGVMTIFNAFMADFLNGVDSSGEPKAVDPTKYPTLSKKEDAINFLKKYGARPYYEEQPMVRAPIYEAFLAYQKFCLKWSEQFKTQFKFTFMPELFPGGIVAFPEHGLQCYVSSVTHNCSYENGFTTTAELMAPSAYKNQDGTPADPDKSWVHAGMIRAWPDTEAVGTFTGATDEDPAKKDKEKK